MNLQSFAYMRALAEERSFTAAARRLHITQQTLSAHVAALEKELGCALVVRSSPLALTHEGETFLAHAVTVQNDLDQLARELSGTSAEQTGTLRIGIAHTRGRVLLPGILSRFSAAYPQIAVDVREGSNAQICSALIKRELDLAIAGFEHPLRGIEFFDYYEERVALLVSTALLRSCGIDPMAIEKPLAKGDLSSLATCPFVLGPPEDITGELALRLLSQANFAPQVRVRSSNMETLLGLALCGVGASLSPINLVEATATPAQKRGLKLYKLGKDASYQIKFATPQAGQRWKPIETFMEIARAELKAGD